MEEYGIVLMTIYEKQADISDMLSAALNVEKGMEIKYYSCY